jgi:hypothetical protein
MCKKLSEFAEVFETEYHLLLVFASRLWRRKGVVTARFIMVSTPFASEPLHHAQGDKDTLSANE